MTQYTTALSIAYDGTNYHGWQIQPNGITIQEAIQDALKILLKCDTSIVGSGRTDAGVHALAQVAHFKHEHPLDYGRFLYSLNALIPHDIRVNKIASVHADFHSQYSVISKVYRYHFHLDRIHNPFKRLYSWHVLEKIDLALLERATKEFLGTHDFTSFANEAHRGTASHDAVRNLMRLDAIKEDGGFYLEFEADGFLYKMVRNIVGMLIDIARGKRPLSDVAAVFAAKDRRQASSAAPPQGLFLVKVCYPTNVFGGN